MLFQKRIVAILLFILLMGGCTTAKLPKTTVDSDFDPATDFSLLETYDWMPESPIPTGDPKVDDDRLLHARLRNAIEDELAAKGYVKFPSGTPDFLIGYHVAISEKTTIQFLNNYYGYSEGWGWSYEARSSGRPYEPDAFQEKAELAYEQGTLILDISEPEPRKPIWRGVATASIDPLESGDARINATVKQLLGQFPPPQTMEE